MGIQPMQTVEEDIRNFKDVTHQLNNYNEIYNLNQHISSENKKASGTLRRTNEVLKTGVMSEKEAFFLSEHKKNMYIMKRNVMYMSLIVFGGFFILAALMMDGVLTKKRLYIALGVGVFLWLVLLAMIVGKTPARRLNDWSMYYWGDRAPVF